MNKSRKLMSLLLVLVLALPMVFMTVNALAEDATITFKVVKTSGGRLNVWAGPVKKAGTAVGSIANGKEVTLDAGYTYSTRDKVWMQKISAPVAGWVQANYIGNKTVLKKNYVEEGKEGQPYLAVANTTGGKLNIWANPNFKGSIVMTVNKGTRLTVVPVAGKNYSKVFNEDGFVGYVRNKYIMKAPKPAQPPKVVGHYAEAKLVGTAKNSVINLWGDKLNAKGQKPLMQLPLGTVFVNVENWSNKWSKVTFVTADLKEVTGWVQTRWLADLTIK